MTVTAAHDAFQQLGRDLRPGAAPERLRNRKLLCSVNVIELENRRIRFAAVDATFPREVFEQFLAVLAARTRLRPGLRGRAK